MATVKNWVMGARPRTLPAALAPVVAGSAEAARLGHFDLVRAVLAAAVALSLQIGVNYANDYSDGIRGTDSSRVGPVRLVGQSLAEPKSVKFAAVASLALAAVAGAWLALISDWRLILIGALAIAAAWFYTGGKKPYGYLGLGELFVFVFFGLFATLGTEYVQAGSVSLAGLFAACSMGLLSSGLLMINNLRDLEGDRSHGKLTLAVRLGDGKARLLYQAMLLAGILFAILSVRLGFISVLFLLPLFLAMKPARMVAGGASGKDLLPLLAMTSAVLLSSALAIALNIVF
jgi:1,4-dihydroxy-2-naphthoate octaprenyltransferase